MSYTIKYVVGPNGKKRPEAVSSVYDGLIQRLEVAITRMEKLAKDADGGWQANNDPTRARVWKTKKIRSSYGEIDRVYFNHIAITSSEHNTSAAFVAANEPAIVLKRCKEERDIIAVFKSSEKAAKASAWDRGYYEAMCLVIERMADYYGVLDARVNVPEPAPEPKNTTKRIIMAKQVRPGDTIITVGGAPWLISEVVAGLNKVTLIANLESGNGVRYFDYKSSEEILVISSQS